MQIQFPPYFRQDCNSMTKILDIRTLSLQHITLNSEKFEMLWPRKCSKFWLLTINLSISSSISFPKIYFVTKHASFYKKIFRLIINKQQTNKMLCTIQRGRRNGFPSTNKKYTSMVGTQLRKLDTTCSPVCIRCICFAMRLRFIKSCYRKSLLTTCCHLHANHLNRC